jgi:hypothetical protein
VDDQGGAEMKPLVLLVFAAGCHAAKPNSPIAKQSAASRDSADKLPVAHDQQQRSDDDDDRQNRTTSFNSSVAPPNVYVAALRSRRREIQSCFADRRADAESAQIATLTYQLVVDAAGRVIAARVTGVARDVEVCLSRVLMTLQLSSAQQGTIEISYPFHVDSR